ncbi:MAG: transketolase family protein [Nitrospinae bacterium]|nr:transketolase family protein [Nitrospinota bacterium]
MVEMLAPRDFYGKTLVELGKTNKDIVVLDCDLSGSTRTSLFAKAYPDRFFNMGVAEQDMIGTAAGLAAGGKIPFASTFAMFASGRAWEQIRQSVAYPRANVKVVASHGGITVGPDGPSHQAGEDIAIMRAIPDMTVIVPADAYETAAAVRAVVEYRGPVYLRLPRDKFPVVYKEGKTFEIGKATLLRKGNEVTFITCGLMTETALRAAAELETEGVSAGVVDMPTIKPLDVSAVILAAQESGAIVTAEEHTVIGGLGSAIAETIGESRPVPVVRVGIPDTYFSSGSPEELLEACGLTTVGLKEAALRAVTLKKHPVRVRE